MTTPKRLSSWEQIQDVAAAGLGFLFNGRMPDKLPSQERAEQAPAATCGHCGQELVESEIQGQYVYLCTNTDCSGRRKR